MAREFVPFYLGTLTPVGRLFNMTHTPQNPHKEALDNVLLPRWMRITAILSVVVVAGIVLVALSTGAEQTPIEQSPYRSAPEEVLSPGQ